MMRRTVLVLTLGLAGIATLSADNWPAWRGPRVERRQPGDGPAGQVEPERERRVEAGDAEPQRGDADHLERSHLPQRCHRAHVRRARAVVRRSHQAARCCGSGPLSGGNHQQAQAEHVVALARHRWHERLGHDRHRHPEGVRLQRQRDSGRATSRRTTAALASTGATPRRRSCTRTRSTCRCCTA